MTQTPKIKGLGAIVRPQDTADEAPATPTDTPAVEAIAEPQPKRKPIPVKGLPEGAKVRRQAQGADAQNVGIYAPSGLFSRARDAYVSDMVTRPETTAATFGDWIVDSVQAHTRRSAAERVEIAARLKQHKFEGKGVSRTFWFPFDVLAEVDEAQEADRAHQLARGRSKFMADAITLAIEDATAANGGDLPPFQGERLPNGWK